MRFVVSILIVVRQINIFYRSILFSFVKAHITQVQYKKDTMYVIYVCVYRK